VVPRNRRRDESAIIRASCAGIVLHFRIKN
jgi:hypothetical protein